MNSFLCSPCIFLMYIVALSNLILILCAFYCNLVVFDLIILLTQPHEYWNRMLYTTTHNCIFFFNVKLSGKEKKTSNNLEYFVCVHQILICGELHTVKMCMSGNMLLHIMPNNHTLWHSKFNVIFEDTWSVW